MAIEADTHTVDPLAHPSPFTHLDLLPARGPISTLLPALPLRGPDRVAPSPGAPLAILRSVLLL